MTVDSFITAKRNSQAGLNGVKRSSNRKAANMHGSVWPTHVIERGVWRDVPWLLHVRPDRHEVTFIPDGNIVACVLYPTTLKPSAWAASRALGHIYAKDAERPGDKYCMCTYLA
jgi:hypothetical protein